MRCVAKDGSQECKQQERHWYIVPDDEAGSGPPLGETNARFTYPIDDLGLLSCLKVTSFTAADVKTRGLQPRRSQFWPVDSKSFWQA